MRTEYYRKDNTITSVAKNEDGGPKETLLFKSINKAKKESRKIQGSSLGSGVLRVISVVKKYRSKKITTPKYITESMEDFREELVVAITDEHTRQRNRFLRKREEK